MRAIWKASISFGLVNIPINLYSATRERELKFTLLHKRDMSTVRYAKICKEEEKEIPYEEIVKGYEYEKGNYIILTDEDFEKANVEKTKSIEILDFTDEDEIDIMYYDRPYFLEPDKGANKAYALLRDALKKSKKVGIAKFVLKNHEHLAVIKPHGKALILNQMRTHAEVLEPVDLKLPEEEKVSGKEMEMALQLIEHLSGPFHPEQYKDTYTEEIKEIIAKKAKGIKIKPKGKAPKPSKVTDIMTLLKASLEHKPEKTKKTLIHERKRKVK